MMRLAKIICVASDLDGSVRSLPRPCKNAQALSNASQIVRVLLNSNASGVLTMTELPHVRHALVRARTDAQKGPVMKWMGGPVAAELGEEGRSAHAGPPAAARLALVAGERGRVLCVFCSVKIG